jgi:hypothetical protein
LLPFSHKRKEEQENESGKNKKIIIKI